MARISRREFLAGMAAAGAAAAVGGRLALAGGAPAKALRGSDLVTLGKTECRPTVLGIGTGTHGGREQREMGSDAFTRLVRHALDRGVRYIDTADAYMMHTFVRLALKGVKRFRRELRTDYLDSVLMHCMQKPGWPDEMRPVLEVLLEEKQKGRIKAVGVSCHGWNGFAPSVNCPDLDVQLVRINPFGIMMDGKPEAVAAGVKKMHANGRGVIRSPTCSAWDAWTASRSGSRALSRLTRRWTSWSRRRARCGRAGPGPPPRLSRRRPRARVARPACPAGKVDGPGWTSQPGHTRLLCLHHPALIIPCSSLLWSVR